MIPGKEALVNLERMAKAQYQVYNDAADLGIEVTENELNGIRADVKTLKGIYSGINFKTGHNETGVRKIVVPLEEVEAAVYRTVEVTVRVRKESLRTLAFIEFVTSMDSAEEVPFLAPEKFQFKSEFA
ncbi:MAG: hypothetical protein DRQ58_10875 [Gammaproteobacteria bacterium]|nr:MAG: hypothetical protein DRQ58_10875 [Gammaproteobacteria bacterium]